ncbi:MAG: hypothetical protein PHN42_01535 [Bacilli bacterium]|nr:hypothetical protein [Bacilli bacterium]
MSDSKIKKALREAISNSNVEQNPLSEREIEIIAKALENKDKSFFKNLYDLIEKEKNNDDATTKSR